MSHEQDGSTPEMREDMNSQTQSAMGEAPAYQNPPPDSAQPGYHAMHQDRYMGGAGHPPAQNQGNNGPPNSAQPGYHAMHQDRYMGGAGHPPVQNQGRNEPPNFAQPGYHTMHQDRYMGGAGYSPVQNGNQMPNGPYQGQGYHAMPQGAGHPPVQNGGQMPNWPHQGQGYNNQQAPGSPYQAQNQGSNGPYQNHYYDPYMANPGYPPRMPENNPPANGGFSSFFDFRDERFLKGALVGAAATFLLTNDSVQKNAINSIVKVWSLFQGGLEEVKERFRDAEAEIKTETNQK